MGTEIEYRYLLRTRPPLDGLSADSIMQGYLSTDPDRAVRVRARAGKGYLTVKGRKNGASATEFQYEIPYDDAIALLTLCGDHVLTKDRYEWPSLDGFLWEIDIFTGRHAGLMIAEIEVSAEGTVYQHPAWLDGIDVTTDARLGNASLVVLDNTLLQAVLAEYGF